MKLTIGMSCYDDYDGVWFTIQSIKMYHSECIDDINFVVIDGNPESKHGKSCEKLISKLTNKHGNNGLYVKNVSWPSTASRDYIFQFATTPYVLCLDSHVMLQPGSIKKLIDYYDQNPTCNDLLQGPLLDDNGKLFANCMEPKWDYNMFGTWLIDESKTSNTEPYEITMMGLGLFSCRKQAWPGFNPSFQGFGGEEGYIHKKFQKRGDKTLILPWLKWNHRFDRPNGVPYRNEYIDRIKNYLLGWSELDVDTKDIKEYYSKPNTTPGQEREAVDMNILNDLDISLNHKNDKISTINDDTITKENAQLKERIIELEIRLLQSHSKHPVNVEPITTHTNTPPTDSTVTTTPVEIQVESSELTSNKSNTNVSSAVETYNERIYKQPPVTYSSPNITSTKPY